MSDSYHWPCCLLIKLLAWCSLLLDYLCLFVSVSLSWRNLFFFLFIKDQGCWKKKIKKIFAWAKARLSIKAFTFSIFRFMLNDSYKLKIGGWNMTGIFWFHLWDTNHSVNCAMLEEKKRDIADENESDWDINQHIPEGHSLAWDVPLAGWLGCRSARPAGLHIADRCSASQACSATGSVCSRKTLRPDATTWWPTRLPLQWPSHDLKPGFAIAGHQSHQWWSGAETESFHRVSAAASPLHNWQAECMCQIVLNNQSFKGWRVWNARACESAEMRFLIEKLWVIAKPLHDID